MWYVYTTFVLTERKYKFYDLGEASQRAILFVLFIWASTYIIAILLNMLIALMQKTFAGRRLVAEQVKIQDHLKFVLDNWHLMNFAMRNKSSIKYVIACTLSQDSTSSDQAINELK